MFLAQASGATLASAQLFIPNEGLSLWLMTMPVSLCAASALCRNSRLRKKAVVCFARPLASLLVPFRLTPQVNASTYLQPRAISLDFFFSLSRCARNLPSRMFFSTTRGGRKSSCVVETESVVTFWAKIRTPKWPTGFKTKGLRFTTCCQSFFSRQSPFWSHSEKINEPETWIPTSTLELWIRQCE